jgi:hypothetical protein
VPVGQPIADECDRDATTAADLEHDIVGLYVEQLDGPADAFGRSSC